MTAASPFFEFQGNIVSVDVRDSYSRHYSAYLQIHTTSGSDITVHVSDSSPFLRPGEGVYVRYRGDTGELINAAFYAQDGKQEGVLRSSQTACSLGIIPGRLILHLGEHSKASAVTRRARINVHHRHGESSEPMNLFPPNE